MMIRDNGLLNARPDAVKDAGAPFLAFRRARKDEAEGAFLDANRPGPARAALATGQLAGL
jgi:hypothetical protein